MNSSILTINDLKQMTQYEQTGDVEKCLTRLQIPFFRGKKGALFTTVGLVEAAGGLVSGKVEENDQQGFM